MFFNLYFLKLIWPYFNWQYIKLGFPKLNPLSVLTLTHEIFSPYFFPSGWKGKGSEQLGKVWLLTKDNPLYWKNNSFQTLYPLRRIKHVSSNFYLSTVETKWNYRKTSSGYINTRKNWKRKSKLLKERRVFKMRLNDQMICQGCLEILSN